MTHAITLMHALLDARQAAEHAHAHVGIAPHAAEHTHAPPKLLSASTRPQCC